jgi:hypothetical protein
MCGGRAGVYAIAGPVAAQQSQDEAACYAWAVDNTGSDPFQVQQQQSQAQSQATEAQMNALKNGFSACLEGKQYIAKF